ncbi:MAG: four helix bundle protein [Flavobacterium sp.]|nr:four helix bundle protein [Flavobacterium sp.]
MGTFSSFEEIIAWQKARMLNVDFYEVSSQNFHFAKDFSLRDQMRRSSISISSNIAEGFERETVKEFIRFLYIAKASAGEFRSQLYLAYDLKYLTDADFTSINLKINEISKLISGLIKYLVSTLKP